MDYYSIDPTSFRYISHHGIKGQKWGVRRYQNEDGTRTEAGKKRYSWLQDKLGYDERDRATRAEANRQRASQDLLRAQREYDTTRQAKNNATRRADKAGHVWENLHKDGYISYPDKRVIYRPYGPNGPGIIGVGAGSPYLQDVVNAWEVQEELNRDLAEQLESTVDKNKEALDKAKLQYDDMRWHAELAIKSYKMTPLGVIDTAKTSLRKGTTFVNKVLSMFKKRDKDFTNPTTSKGHSTHPKTGVGGQIGAPGDKVFLGKKRITRR